MTIDELKAQLLVWKRSGEQIVFTNGVFDILHVGHVRYLTQARALGTKLVVAVNSDRSTRMLGKGPDRPINSEENRATIIGALKAVDAVVIFDEATPFALLMQLKPDILVKGGDYDPDEVDENSKSYIVGSKEIREYGGKVAVLQFVEGQSTTNIIQKIKA